MSFFVFKSGDFKCAGWISAGDKATNTTSGTKYYSISPQITPTGEINRMYVPPIQNQYIYNH